MQKNNTESVTNEVSSAQTSTEQTHTPAVPTTIVPAQQPVQTGEDELNEDGTKKSKNQLKKEKKQKEHEEKQKLKQAKEAEQKAQQTQEPKEAKETKKKEKKQAAISAEYIAEFNSQKLNVLKEKTLPEAGKNNVLITSALPYVNNVPHLGNIIGCVLSADVYARYKRLAGDNVMYICGTDEYGTATEVKALEEKKSPKEVCDFYHQIHANIYKWFDIDFDYFGRTSTEWHTKITQEIFTHIHEKKLMQEDTIQQCYCEKCDLFLADRFVTGTCPTCAYEGARGDQCDKCQRLFNSPTELQALKCHICKNTPIVRETKHFFIDLPQIQPNLESWINEVCKKGEWTENSIAVTQAWLKTGLRPKCITRDLKWGVPVPLPGFEKKVFYVWFDAPIGYISITANYLQEDYRHWWHNPDLVKLYQFMGKDNIPFHTVMFPSSLIASSQGWTLLHNISTTEYLNYEDGKFSKSRKTGVFGDNAQDIGVPSEVWRYYLLVNRPEKSDSEFSWEDFAKKNNNQLLKNLGNLCNRALKFACANYECKIPELDEKNFTALENTLLSTTEEKFQKYCSLMDQVEIKEGLKTVMEISSIGNKYVQDTQFWDKESKESGRSRTVVGVIARFIRFVSAILEPYMPSSSAKINFMLGVEKRTARDNKLIQYLRNNNFRQAFLSLTEESQGLREPLPLFREFTAAEIEEWRARFKGVQGEA